MCRTNPIGIDRFLHIYRHIYRFNAVLLRERFDKNKDILDMRIARSFLVEGERELFLKQHPQPFSCEFPRYLKMNAASNKMNYLYDFQLQTVQVG